MWKTVFGEILWIYWNKLVANGLCLHVYQKWDVQDWDYISPSRSGTFKTNIWEMFYCNLFQMQLYGFVILVNQLLSSELSINIEDSDLYASDKQALSRLHKSFLPLFATSEYVLRMPEPYLIFCGIKWRINWASNHDCTLILKS